MDETRLVITAASSISSIGIGFNSLATNLQSPVQLHAVQEFEFHTFNRPIHCFRITDFDPAAILGKKGLRTKDLATKILLSTLEIGFKDRFENESLESEPGIVIGTAFGSIQSIGDFLSDSIINGVNAVNPMLFANTVINSPTGNANIRYEAKNLSTTVSTGFNAGIDAILYSCDYIKQGYLPALISGGLEEISYYTLMGLDRMGLLSRSESIKPFSQEADGTVMGEGCALFMIETEESAKAHNAEVIAEIAGYSSTFDPDGIHGNGEAIKVSIEQACTMAGIQPRDIGFIAASGNGIVKSDSVEASVIRNLFSDTPVTAYKTKTGECYGASSALSLACALSDLQNNRISGIDHSYEAVNSLNLLSKTVDNINNEYALVTSFSCDGNCASLIVRNSDN